MRSILERAIEHLLNEDHDKAESLFHKFIVDRARQIHESLRQGDEVALTEGWDDEIVSEEYFSDSDLDDSSDDMSDDMSSDTSMSDDTDVDTLSNDEDVDPDADTEMDADPDMDADAGSTADKLNDFEAELEKLTAQFKDMIATLDVDGTDPDDIQDKNMGDEPDMSGDENDMSDDDMSGEDTNDGDMSSDMSSDVDSDEPTVEEDDEEMWENYNLDDITESVIAELEKISVDSTTDGKMTDGKKITQNTKSNLPMKPVNQREGGTPAKSPFTKNDSMARETPPVSKQIPHGKLNSYKKTSDLEKSVEKNGAPNAALNKDFAGGPKPSKSPIAGK